MECNASLGVVRIQSDVTSSTEESPSDTKLIDVTREIANAKSDDIVVVLSDSDEEDTMKTDQQTIIVDNTLSTQSTSIIDPMPAVNNIFIASNAPETVAVASDKGTKEVCDDDVVMLEDDSVNISAAAIPHDTESSKINFLISNGVEERSEEITANVEPLTLMNKLVEICNQLERESAEIPCPPEATETVNATKLDEPENNQSSIKLISTQELLSTNALKAQKNWECVNFECKSTKLTAFYKAPLFALNHFNVKKKVARNQYICENCFDKCVDDYERMCTALVNQQPLLMEKLPIRQELVEILDSSEEEDNGGGKKFVDDAKSLSLATLTLLEDHFEDTFKNTLDRVGIDLQMNWSNQILKRKVENNEAMSDELDVEIKSLQKLADSMYEKLYVNKNFLIEELPPFDLNTNKQINIAGPFYPPYGEVIYPPVDHHSLYYAVRATLLTTWIPCKVTEIVDGLDGQKSYKVRFLRTKGILSKTVPGNNLAYGTAPGVRLTVGKRVIALFNMEQGNDNTTRSSFLPGIVAEPLQAYNRWRYLIFFDDGYAQYVTPDNIRLLCSPSPNCWDDVYPDSAEFIKSYLNQYTSQRPMVQVKRGQKMITEFNGEWTHARVNDIDASLIQMYFDTAKRWEWIYRGSTRLGPLYKEKQIQKHSVGSAKRNKPFVEYMSIDDEDKNDNNQTPNQQPIQPPISPINTTIQPPTLPIDATIQLPTPPTNVPSPSQTPQTAQSTPEQEQKRSVAKKSVSVPSRIQPVVHHMNNATIYVEEDTQPKGKVVYYTAKKHVPPRKFVRHNCGEGCLYKVKHNLSTYSPLAKPLLSGWERKVLKCKSKKVVEYRGPCGRNLRNMCELHKYLRATKCSLNVDNFDFDYLIHCLAEYVTDKCIFQKNDISDGQEPMAVSCVNYYDKTMPPPCVYSAVRVPNEGVNLNLDANFLCGCDCEDDCMDKTKCQCWKLTLQGAEFVNPNIPIDEVGYKFKRLQNSVSTGIYECNQQCKCSKNCLNRVAQHPLQTKLQVFKTESRGWGLRCLNDVPKGSFICVYAGDLLTEENANIAGGNYGDEYFAELDYIEVVESLKEGYESGVMDDDFDDDEHDADKKDDDDGEFVATIDSHGPRQTRYNTRQTSYNTRHSVNASNGKKKENSKVTSHTKSPESETSEDEDAQRQLISFIPNATSFEGNSSGRHKSIRNFYGKNESVFIMDAKRQGNIGRYFNHSCSPNLFVQNVFVDTHDLRFPWVAFFALSHIRAGSELTWNYNYEVGSVPGKVMFCECRAENCRGRLL